MLSLTADSVTIRTFKDHMMVQGKSVQSVAVKVLKGLQVHVCSKLDFTIIDIHTVYLHCSPKESHYFRNKTL